MPCRRRRSIGSRPRGRKSRLATALPLAVVLSAIGCDGGSSTTGAGDDTGLTGRLLVDDGADTRRDGTLYEVDPSTGAVREHVAAASDLDERYSSSRSFSVGGADDGGTLLYGVNDCPVDLASAFCVERIDADGTVERLFAVDGWVHAPPVLSPDGGTIAALVSPGQIDGPYSLVLYDRTGESIASQRLSDRAFDNSHYDWTPDGRLVYGLVLEGEGALVLVAAPGSLTPERAFPVADASRAVGAISVSPDGGAIAYELYDVDDIENTTSWVLDVASEESIIVARDDGNAVFGPEWSPDGRHLAVRYGVGTSTAVGPLGTGASSLPFMMVVEWTGETVELAPYDGIGRVLIAQTKIPDGGFGPPRDDGRWVYGRPFWVR